MSCPKIELCATFRPDPWDIFRQNGEKCESGDIYTLCVGQESACCNLIGWFSARSGGVTRPWCQVASFFFFVWVISVGLVFVDSWLVYLVLCIMIPGRVGAVGPFRGR